MARPKIEELRSLSDFTSKYRWNLTFSKFPAGVSGAPSSSDLNLRCESLTLPKSQTTVREVNIRGHKVRNPGIREYEGTITLTFVETVDSKVRAFIKAWQDAIWSANEGTAGTKKEVEAEITLQLLLCEFARKKKILPLSGIFHSETLVIAS